MKINNVSKLVIAIVVSELVGVIGSVFTTPSIATWYATLAKPALNPPAWVFAPVWTALFFLMGIAAFLVWKNGLNKKEVKVALEIFIGQLVFNIFWSILFFGLHRPDAAFVEIIALWLMIMATIIAFAKVSRAAAWLLVPYIIWVSFASYLNFSIWMPAVTVTRPIACTQEAKICPDGSAVGRTGANCEFATCPAVVSSTSATEGWKTFVDSTSSVSFLYPESLATIYVSTVDWPPQVKILNQQFTCASAGTETTPGGQTVSKIILGRTYCITKEAEGAAGSIYINYTYAFPNNNKTAIFTFSLRFPQCVNYDDPKKTACANEEASFDINNIIDPMAQSLKLN